MAREKYDKGELLGGSGANSMNVSNADFMKGRKDASDVPDSNVLLAILNRKGKFDKDLN